MALALHRVHEGLHLVNHELRQTETLQLPHSSPDVWVVLVILVRLHQTLHFSKDHEESLQVKEWVPKQGKEDEAIDD